MLRDALGERAPTEAALDLAYKLACEANCKAAIYWQNYISTGDHQGIFEPLSKLAIELTKALVRTPLVAGWLIECNCTKEPPLEFGDREFSTAHHAALECVCRVVDGVISETRPNRKFDRRCFIGWNWEKLEKRITREWRRAVESLPEEIQSQSEDDQVGWLHDAGIEPPQEFYRDKWLTDTQSRIGFAIRYEQYDPVTTDRAHQDYLKTQALGKRPRIWCRKAIRPKIDVFFRDAKSLHDAEAQLKNYQPQKPKEVGGSPQKPVRVKAKRK